MRKKKRREEKIILGHSRVIWDFFSELEAEVEEERQRKEREANKKKHAMTLGKTGNGGVKAKV